MFWGKMFATKTDPLIRKKLDHKFKIIAFDWDGTAVKSRHHPVDDILWRLESLLKNGVKVVIITGTHFGNIDSQFCSKVKPELKKNLYVCVNRGSEVYGFDENGKPVVLHRREATAAENALMDRVSEEMKSFLKEKYNLDVEIIANRFNRRKLDLYPYPEWADPPKEKIDELLTVVEKHLRDFGITNGIQEVIDLVKKKVKSLGGDLRITTDVKHIEYGLTDKSDSVNFVITEIARKKGISNEDILFLGDEFGPIGGFEGSDFRMVTPIAKGATYISVGKEPNGVPEGVLYYGKGTKGFKEIIDTQLRFYNDEKINT